MKRHSPFLSYDEFSDKKLKDFLQIYTNQYIDKYFEGENFKKLNEMKQIMVGIKRELVKREKQEKTQLIVRLT